LTRNQTHAWTLGTQRRAVGYVGTDPAVEAAARWEGAPPEGPARGVERGLMDFRHWGAVAGDAAEISTVPNLPSALSAVGRFGGAGQGVAEAGATVASRGPLESGGSLHRRHVCGGEKGGFGVGPAKRGKGTKITAITVGDSVPVAISVQAASSHESQLVEETLGHSFLDELPARLIGDKAYDSDTLDRQMQEQYGVEVIAPHRSNRVHPTQDGRPLRRYRRRWTIERLFAWLQVFRRLVTRYEYHIENFLGMVRLGCMKIMLRYF
jgi:transposase